MLNFRISQDFTTFRTLNFYHRKYIQWNDIFLDRTKFPHIVFCAKQRWNNNVEKLSKHLIDFVRRWNNMLEK